MREEHVERGSTKAEPDQVIEWLTGFDESKLSSHLAAVTTFQDFFADAELNAHASLITRVNRPWGPLSQSLSERANGRRADLSGAP